MTETALRVAVLVAVALNLVWTTPLAWRSLRGPVAGWPNAGFGIPLTGLLLATMLFQTSALAGWTSGRPAALLLVLASLLVLKLMHISRLVEIEKLDDETTGSLRLWRRLWRKR